MPDHNDEVEVPSAVDAVDSNESSVDETEGHPQTDPCRQSASSPPPEWKTYSTDDNPRSFYLTSKGKPPLDDGENPFPRKTTEKVDVLEVITTEIKCTRETAARLRKADLVRIADHHEIVGLTRGIHVEPGSLSIGYRCVGAKRSEDIDVDEEETFRQIDGKWVAADITESEHWRAKCLDGRFASMDSNDGYPIFTPWSDAKYVSPRGAPGCLVFVPTVVNPAAYDKPEVVYIVEGEKKAILMAQMGFAAISISGVAAWGYKPDKQRAAALGIVTSGLAPILTEILEGLGARKVVISFDSPDIYGQAGRDHDSDSVVKEAGKLAVALMAAKYEAGWLVLPRPPASVKWGVDDWLIAHPNERIGKYIVAAPDEFRAALEAPDERREAILMLMLARARALGGSSPKAQVKACLKRLGCNNEDELLDLLEVLAADTPEKWLERWVEHHEATYSYKTQSMVLGGVLKPTSSLMERLRLDAPQFSAQKLNDAFGQWAERQDEIFLDSLREKLRYRPDAGKGLAGNFVFACTGDVDPADIAVIKHFVWQVKRRLFCLPVDHHLMAVLYREREHGKNAQGGGKSTAVRMLLGPVEPVVVELADLREAADPRGLARYTRMYVSYLDELAGADRADLASLKRLITQKNTSWRIMGHNKDDHGTNNTTFIATANRSITESIPDTTGIRRYYQIRCLEKLDWQLINELDYVALWQSVNENGKAPILEAKDIVDARQEEWRAKDQVEEWVAGMDVKPDMPQNVWPSARAVYSAFVEDVRKQGRTPMSETAFGIKLKLLVGEKGHKRSKEGHRYAVFPKNGMAPPLVATDKPLAN